MLPSTPAIPLFRKNLEAVPEISPLKRMKWAYVGAAARLARSDKPGLRSTVDAAAQRRLQDRLDTRGFPTIKLFCGGQVAAEYNGERTADAPFSYRSSPLAGPNTEL